MVVAKLMVIIRFLNFKVLTSIIAIIMNILTIPILWWEFWNYYLDISFS